MLRVCRLSGFEPARRTRPHRMRRMCSFSKPTNERTNDRTNEMHQITTTESVDCWAVGVLAYEFLVGHTPFRPPPASSPYSSPNKLNAKHASASPYAADPEQNQLYNSILNSVVSFPPHVSPEARDFISRLLERNPRRRMRLREAFAHRWIRQHATAAAAAAGGVQMPAAAGAVAAAPRE